MHQAADDVMVVKKVANIRKLAISGGRMTKLGRRFEIPAVRMIAPDLCALGGKPGVAQQGARKRLRRWWVEFEFGIEGKEADPGVIPAIDPHRPAEVSRAAPSE